MTISAPSSVDLGKEGFQPLVSPGSGPEAPVVAQLQSELSYTLRNAQTGETIQGAQVRPRADDGYSFVGVGKYKEGFGYTGTWLCLAGNGVKMGMAVPSKGWWYKAE